MGSDEICEASEDGRFDLEDVAGFVGVEVAQEFLHYFFGCCLEGEGWVVVSCWCSDAFLLLMWDGQTGSVSYCDVVVIQRVGNLLWVCVGFVLVGDAGWGDS